MIYKPPKPVWYDPPSGWQYGFPKEFKPLYFTEPIADVLRRDGYPEEDCEWAADHTRFWGGHIG